MLRSHGLPGRRIEPLAAQIQHKDGHPRLMRQHLPAVIARRSHIHDSHVVIPLVRRRHGARVRAAAEDGDLVAAQVLAAQLADVELVAPRAHAGVARVTDMRVVRPDDGLARGVVLEETAEGVEHVRVAEGPRARGAVVHGFVVALSVADEVGVLLAAVHLVAVARLAGLLRVLQAVAEDVAQHGHHLALTVLQPAQRHQAVRGQIINPWLQTAVASSR